MSDPKQDAVSIVGADGRPVAVPRSRVVVMAYTNWKGVRSWRRIVPCAISFAATEHHPEEQWLLTAYDLDQRSMRNFALKDIHEWRAEP